MKIQKTKKINFARFNNFNWDNTLDDFSSFVNIMLGWNGSGKTTFSKLMRGIELNSLEEENKFCIQTDSNEVTELKNLELFSGKIRVFNEDFVEETLRASESIPYIFYAGKEAIDFDEEEKKLAEKKENYSKISIPSNHDEIAKTTAVLVKEVGGINSVSKELIGGGTYASYNKSDFEKRIANINEKIEKKSIESHKDLIAGDIDELKTQLSNIKLVSESDKKIAEISNWILDNIEEFNYLLLSTPQQVHSKRINLLEDKQKEWIEDGVRVHFTEDKNLDTCLFCNSEIKNKDELIKHFSKQVVATIEAIDSYLEKFESYSKDLARVHTTSDSQKKSISFLRTTFDQLTSVFQDKRDDVSAEKEEVLINVEELKRCKEFRELNSASIAYAIETHYVAQKFQDYNREKEIYEQYLLKKKTAEKEIKALEEKVKLLKQKVRNTHEPAKALNYLFKIVFPFRKIEIVDSEDGKGYVLKRDGMNCNFSSLSDGEKNFIALAYFIYSINDSQNRLPDDGIVVIDDPVSSLDKQAIFQIFSIIVNEIKARPLRQYFILTHNLDFFSHLRTHFKKKINTGSIKLYSFVATNSGCEITKIHSLLKSHRSDYYYVFDVLNQHKDDCSEEDAYLVVNLLRRWLETFLEFKFSAKGDFKSTLEMAYIEANRRSSSFKANHLDMYRFTNHGSHGFADTESIDDSLLSGASQRIIEAFELVEVLDELHFNKLMKESEKNI